MNSTDTIERITRLVAEGKEGQAANLYNHSNLTHEQYRLAVRAGRAERKTTAFPRQSTSTRLTPGS